LTALPETAETGLMAAETRVPREHDRVTAEGQSGVFNVVDVDEKARTVTLQTVTGNGPVVPGVSWAALKYMDEEEHSAERT